MDGSRWLFLQLILGHRLLMDEQLACDGDEVGSELYRSIAAGLEGRWSDSVTRGRPVLGMLASQPGRPGRS